MFLYLLPRSKTEKALMKLLYFQMTTLPSKIAVHITKLLLAFTMVTFEQNKNNTYRIFCLLYNKRKILKFIRNCFFNNVDTNFVIVKRKIAVYDLSFSFFFSSYKNRFGIPFLRYVQQKLVNSAFVSY